MACMKLFKLLVIVFWYFYFLFRRGPVKLGMAKITQVDFPPREIVTYTKETQTPVMTQPKEGECQLTTLYFFSGYKSIYENF